MKKTGFKNIVFYSVTFIIIFSCMARGGMRDWVVYPVELIVFSLLFVWLCGIDVFNRDLSGRGVGDNTSTVNKLATTINVMVLFSMIVVVNSVIFSVYKEASVQEMMKGLVFAGIFYLTVFVLDVKSYMRFSIILVFLIVALSLFGLAQYFLGIAHSWWIPKVYLASTYVNHNHFAGLLEMAIPLGICLFFSERVGDISARNKYPEKLFLFLAVMLMFFTLLLTQSRGAFIGLASSAFVLMMFLLRAGIADRKVVLLVVFCLVIVFILIVSGYDNPSERIKSIGQIESDVSWITRIKIWHGALQMIKNNLLTGTGIGTFVWAFPAYRPEGLIVKAHYAHNDYLQIAAETGIAGLIVSVILLLCVILLGFSLFVKYNNIGKKNARGVLKKFGRIEAVILGCTVGVLSMAIHGLVDFNFHIFSNMMIVSVMAGMITGMARRNFFK